MHSFDHLADRAAERGSRAPSRAASLVLTLGITIASLGVAGSAQAREEYDPTRAGNPLKIVYYAVYPAAFLLDRLIFRPAYYIGQYEPFHSLFGTTRPPEEIEIEPAEPIEEEVEGADS